MGRHFLRRKIEILTRIDRVVEFLNKFVAKPKHVDQLTTPRIFVDVTQLCADPYVTGIQRVAQKLILELTNNPTKNYQIVLIAACGTIQTTEEGPCFPGTRNSIIFYNQISFKKGDVLLTLDNRSIRFQAFLMMLMEAKRAGCKFIPFVHDIFPISYPFYFTSLGKVKFRRWLNVLLNNADLYITPSHNSANQLRAHAGNLLDQRSVHVVPLGGDFFITERSACSLHQSPDRESPFLLMVGTIEPRKGYSDVLAAMELLWSEGFPYDLCLVGRAGWNNKNIIAHLNRLTETNRLHWIDDVNDRQLAKLYQDAHGLIAASHDEGFCLPIAEALHFRTPVLARNINIFSEVGGDLISYFESGSIAELAEAIKAWEHTPKPEERGTSCENYTWKASGIKLASVLHNSLQPTK
jgi:glycosyltransferase involved in cell wall biosynthesis